MTHRGIKFVKKANMWQVYQHTSVKKAGRNDPDVINQEEWFLTEKEAEERLAKIKENLT